MKTIEFSGVFELEPKGYGFIRKISKEFHRDSSDIYVPSGTIQDIGLRDGCLVTGTARDKNGQFQVGSLHDINGVPPNQYKNVPELTRQTAIAPDQRIVLETSDVTTRVIDLISPIGRGQRALIVSPPRAGKTILMQKIAEAISRNHKDLELLMLLVDERPEEVTEMERSIRGKVFASSNDRDFNSHARIARMTLEYAKRQVEVGKDVVILLDSLTRLGRAFNAGIKGSGRIMSGGIDARALEIPKKIFGASRNIEHGGSLTIIATILVDTGSQMDELIFQEFKGTGNSEIVLDRELADHRIFPAINIQLSGTRREELLLGEDTEMHFKLRRALLDGGNREAMQGLIEYIKRFRTNRELLQAISAMKMESSSSSSSLSGNGSSGGRRRRRI
ncbi:MAG: transcription termination factor Rho [Bacteroidetes bacterium]|nr:transcription termination factor Rho [Bacteroidota bacterium]